VNHYAILSAGLEFTGVFLLSVEAIKLDNIRRLRKVIDGFYRGHVNPYVEFHAGQPSPKEEGRPSKIRNLLEQTSAILVVMFILTPFALVLYPTIKCLESIEKYTQPGIIGTGGFVLWAISFFMNKLG